MSKIIRKDADGAITEFGAQLVSQLSRIAVGDTSRKTHFRAFALSSRVQTHNQ
ncbi:MAG: hypothetical protein JWL62_2220 [Hyphomicrobiales bacterium]|nr:hypothetical protein [Hyphomicrobiales bacterium]